MAKLNKIMNSKEIKVFFDKINKNYGIPINQLKEIFKKYILIRKKTDIWIVSRSVDIKIIQDYFLISQIGIYLCEFHDNILRFSIEGTILLGNFATKNVIEIDDELTKKWLQKKDIDYLSEKHIKKINKQNSDKNIKGFVILKNSAFFLGCGLIKDNKILNYIPKSRCVVNEIW